MLLSDHLEGLRAALTALVRYADRAGLAAPVPTCGDWSVRDLVAHLGMVHRWATASLHGEGADADALEAEGRRAPDPLEWLRDGAVDLARAVVETPPDADVLVFLADAGAGRDFWARRQCHETTMHAVDALSAHLGRRPLAADLEHDGWLTTEVACDGIDELLTGFLPRPKSRLRSEEPMTIAVLPDDADLAWTVEVSDRPPRTTRHRPADLAGHDADVELRGSCRALYLTLWNRSDEVAPHDTRDGEDAWDVWRTGASITWT